MDNLRPRQKQRKCRITQKGIKIEDSAMNQIRITRSYILHNIRITIITTQGINLIPTIATTAIVSV